MDPLAPYICSRGKERGRQVMVVQKVQEGTEAIPWKASEKYPQFWQLLREETLGTPQKGGHEILPQRDRQSSR